jgi:hypothetical protein
MAAHNRSGIQFIEVSGQLKMPNAGHQNALQRGIFPIA